MNAWEPYLLFSFLLFLAIFFPYPTPPISWSVLFSSFFFSFLILPAVDTNALLIHIRAFFLTLVLFSLFSFLFWREAYIYTVLLLLHWPFFSVCLTPFFSFLTFSFSSLAFVSFPPFNLPTYLPVFNISLTFFSPPFLDCYCPSWIYLWFFCRTSERETDNTKNSIF